MHKQFLHTFWDSIATNNIGTVYGDEVTFTTSENPDGKPCPGAPTVTDVDGNVYNTVQIGEQCWMRENLKTTKFANGTTIPLGTETSYEVAYRYYPNGNSNNVAEYGFFYNWSAVMNGSASSEANPSGVQGICPDGWHVPSDAEWTELKNYVSSQSQYVCGGDEDNIAKALASEEGWNSRTDNCDVGYNPIANNATGFSARPAGDYDGYYGYYGYRAIFWSATQFNSNNAYYRSLGYDYAYVYRSNVSKTTGYSVRCVRNEEGSGSEGGGDDNQGGDTTDTAVDAQPCPGAPTVTDVDGNVYNTVQIGEQCWMKENLRTTRYTNGTAIPLGTDTSSTTAYRYYPNNSSNNVATYGFLYNWAAVMNGSSSSSANPSGVQGICPAGWHVPSSTEWTELTDYVSSQSYYICGERETSIAKALASTEGWQSANDECSPGGTLSSNNATGFSALPAGLYDENDVDVDADYEFNYYAFFWGVGDNYASYGIAVSYNVANVLQSYVSTEEYGYSVRCVRNEEGSGSEGGGDNEDGDDNDTTVTAQACPGAPTVTDVDGNVYNTVQIGEQCWMRENLKTTKYANGTTIPLGTETSHEVAYRYYPDSNSANVSDYGYLYNWAAVMKGASSSNSNPSGVQGICPDGWHVPSDAEWTELTDYVSSQSQYVCDGYEDNITKALASKTGWNSTPNYCAVGNNPDANNATGFSARPAGNYDDGYSYFGDLARFWSATQYDSDYANTLYLYYNVAYVGSIPKSV